MKYGLRTAGAILAFSIIAGCGTNAMADMKMAKYLGVVNYGAPETNKENKDNFRYRFLVDGAEEVFSIDNGEQDSGGKYAYPVQNTLKEGYLYNIMSDGNTVKHAVEVWRLDKAYEPPVSGTPGLRTVKNFLKTAMEPVGTTLYMFGGGWDWQDEGSSVQARTIGVADDWVWFFNENDASYTYRTEDAKNTYYPHGAYNEYYYAGLDCSGYVGWALYNTLETENGRPGYVTGSTRFAKSLADRGWGTWTQDIGGTKPGDIMSINGHVWISLGTCEDGSVVILHSTPSKSRTGQPGGGVQIGAVGNDSSCEAARLAEKYMSEYYPKWYERYGVPLQSPNVYFGFSGDTAGLFSWSEAGLKDPEGIKDMRPKEVLAVLFG